METEILETFEKQTLHFVEGDARERARFAQMAMRLGHTCELYDGLSELAAYPPREGIILMRDDEQMGGIINAIKSLEEMEIWLPVIAFGEAPNPRKIVDAIKVGALDYIVMPIEDNRLERCLDRTADEAKRTSRLRRRRIEAQRMIEKLSARENEVLDLLADGQSNKLIAYNLGISPRTVELHRSNMMNKLEATHSASAVRIKLEADHLQTIR